MEMPYTRPLDTGISSLRCISAQEPSRTDDTSNTAMGVCSFTVHERVSFPLPPLRRPHTRTRSRSRVLARTRARHTCIRGISDSMCNDTVRTQSGKRGKEREQRHGVGLAWAAWNHFKRCGGWKAKKKKDVQREEMRVAEKHRKAARPG